MANVRCLLRSASAVTNVMCQRVCVQQHQRVCVRNCSVRRARSTPPVVPTAYPRSITAVAPFTKSTAMRKGCECAATVWRVCRAALKRISAQAATRALTAPIVIFTTVAGLLCLDVGPTAAERAFLAAVSALQVVNVLLVVAMVCLTQENRARVKSTACAPTIRARPVNCATRSSRPLSTARARRAVATACAIRRSSSAMAWPTAVATVVVCLDSNATSPAIVPTRARRCVATVSSTMRKSATAPLAALLSVAATRRVTLSTLAEQAAVSRHALPPAR
mmetsp:Transcript_3405/g.5512  ORF Transcript_3405/g.5512 Transcript_3405/m.5512 type:complete len:278 (-) Transcript_3405:316-1149(-)